MADLQLKLDNCEKKLRSKENDSQDGGEGSSESPTQSRDSLQPSSPVKSLPEAGSPPAGSTLSSGSSTPTSNSVEREGFDFFESIFSEQCDRSNKAEIDGAQIFSPLAIGYVQEKESSQTGSCSTDGT